MFYIILSRISLNIEYLGQISFNLLMLGLLLLSFKCKQSKGIRWNRYISQQIDVTNKEP